MVEQEVVENNIEEGVGKHSQGPTASRNGEQLLHLLHLPE